ncbi:single-stranded DNA-binding protein [Methylocystis sp. IM3]|uniref:single-stranded DNA-binding protein n=1 Tax=unclassified Methylocystis TaxID=2625913 RepID=UPI0030F7076F
MAGSVNKVILIGRVGRDPETRTFQSGDRVVSFSLATSEIWKDRNSGERKERVEWHSIQIHNERIGKVAEQYVKKGSNIYIEGQLQTREYTDKDGNQRKVTEVVVPRFRGEMTLLDSKGGGRGEGDFEGGGYGQSGGGSFGRSSPMERAPAERRPAPTAGGGGGRLSEQLDDDIPF